MDTWFTYTAHNKTGQTVSGIIQAAHRVEAVTMVERMGLQPLSVTENEGPVRRNDPFGLRILAAVLAGLAAVFCALWLGERAQRSRLQDQLAQPPAAARPFAPEKEPPAVRKPPNQAEQEAREEKARQKAIEDSQKEQSAARQARIASNRAKADRLEMQAVNSPPQEAARLRAEAARLIEEARDIEAGWIQP